MSDVSFSVLYTKDLSTLWTWSIVLFAMGLVLAVGAWLFKVTVYQRINRVAVIDVYVTPAKCGRKSTETGVWVADSDALRCLPLQYYI